jgi:hypothetical protein
MKKVLWALVGVALCGSAALAEVPDPANCTVQPADALNGLVLAPLDPTPLPATVNTITVRNSANAPIASANVTVEVSANNSLCASTVLAGTTNGSGVTVITLGGGGCAHNVTLSGLVKANGVTIRAYENVKSPDYDGASGDLQVNLADLVKFSNEFLGSDPAECHDYDNATGTDLGDLIIFSPAFVNPNSCN